MSHPPYNPNAQGAPYPPQAGNVGFEQYQQGAPPPPYSGPAPAPYGGPAPAPYPQQPYGGPPGANPYGGGPYGTTAHHPAGQHPQTVYVYEDRNRRQKQSEEDTCFAMMAGACAMCLCCSLLSD